MKYQLRTGVSMTLLCTLCYSIQTAIIKAKASLLPPLPIIIFFQNVFSLGFLILFFIIKNKTFAFRQYFAIKHPTMHFVRAAFSMGINYFLFYALLYIPLVNAVLLVNTVPLIVPFLAYFFLKQKINHRVWLPIVVGFIGVAVVLHPHGNVFEPASLLALAGALCTSSSVLILRKLSNDHSPESLILYFFLFSTLITFVVAMFFWVSITKAALLWCMLIALLFFGTQLFLIYALIYSPAIIVSMLLYSNIIYSSIIALIFWHNDFTKATLFGILLIVSGGICSIYQEQQHQKKLYKPLVQ